MQGSHAPRNYVFIFLIAFVALLAGSVERSDGTFRGQPGKILLSGNHTYLLNPQTGHMRTISRTAPYTATFLPNGRHFIYISSRNHGIFIRSIKARPKYAGRPILRPTEKLSTRALSVSKDGLIIFSAFPGGRPWETQPELYRIRLDGSGFRRLTRNRVFENDPEISPDGKLIAFVRRVKGRGKIFLMRPDGSNKRRLTRSPGRHRSPSFSPSGKRIAYFASVPGNAYDLFSSIEIFTIHVGGANRYRLTHNEEMDSYPSFSPSGKRVVAVRGYLPAGLFSIAADGSGETRIANVGHDNATDWGPAP